MKQVMCIKEQGSWWSGILSAPCNGPVYCQICTVLEEVNGLWATGYVLEGYGEEPYDARLFIPFSDPAVLIEEEMEMTEV